MGGPVGCAAHRSIGGKVQAGNTCLTLPLSRSGRNIHSDARHAPGPAKTASPRPSAAVARASDETYLRSKGLSAAYFIVDVTRDRLDRIPAMVECGTLYLPVGEFSTSQAPAPPPHTGWRGSRV